MLDGFTIGDAERVQFLLICRSLSDGRTAIVLHLYRDAKPASTTTIATVKPSVARLMLLASRMHLHRLGFSEHSPRLPRAAGLDLAKQAA